MILVIDNFDSFTYNVVQYLQILGHEVATYRNNKITIAEIKKLQPECIVISPGPGYPKDAGISLEVVKSFAGQTPILGICLGHQVIAEAFGGTIIKAQRTMHGKADQLEHDGKGLFYNLPQNLEIIRYHSLAADKKDLPAELEITACSAQDNEIMGLRHKKYKIEGVQFHPESIGSQAGLQLLKNFFNYHLALPKKTLLLQKIAQGENLTISEAANLMDEIMEGGLSESQLGAVLGALAAKGVSVDELSGFALTMRKKTGIKEILPEALDTCGTGGDGKHTFNISTASALLCASTGIKVAKHGNRAITSKSGSFDFLNELNIPTQNKLETNLLNLKNKNFAFFFAPVFHPAMKNVAKVRQDIKIRTVFNLIGPLANPIQTGYQIIGVFDRKLLKLFAQTLKKLNTRRALIVHSKDGLDEFSVCADTRVCELSENGEIKEYIFCLSELGLTPYQPADLAGGTAAENVQLFKEILAGQQKTTKQKAVADAIALNAGAALYIKGTAASIKEGYNKAKKILFSPEFKKYLTSLKNG